MRRLIFNVSGQKIETNSNCDIDNIVLDGAYFKVGAMGDTDEQQIVTDWVTIKQEVV